MAHNLSIFTAQGNFNSDILHFTNSLQSDQSTSMCVISDLFDISEDDRFNSCFDRSPSPTSSLADPHENTTSLPLQPNVEQQPQKQTVHITEKNHIELELLTPDADKSENSFNVLTAQSDDHPFEETLATTLKLDLPLHDSNNISLENDLSFGEDLAFEAQDLLKYTTTQEHNATQLSGDASTRESLQNEQIALETLTTTSVAPDDPFAVPETSAEFGEPQLIDEMIQAVGQPLRLQNSTTNDFEVPEKSTAIKSNSPSEDISFDDLYQAISVNGHLLPDVQSYIAALTETTHLLDAPTHQEPAPKPRKKRKLSKREAARAASAAELVKEEELARLANTKQITDDELLRLKPKKQRRAARFDKPVPSRFCHVCSRTPKNVRLVVCCKIKEGICRKVICEKCFEEYQWGNFEEALETDTSEWVCPHCSGKCPERAQCRTYQRINDRLRVNRLKHEGPRSGKKRIRRQMGSRSGRGDDKRPRFLLPVVTPIEFEGVNVVNPGLSMLDHMGNELEIRDGLEQVVEL